MLGGEEEGEGAVGGCEVVVREARPADSRLDNGPEPTLGF